MIINYTPQLRRPLAYGINIVKYPTEDNLYWIDRSQSFCFPFILQDPYNQILLAASQTFADGVMDQDVSFDEPVYLPTTRVWPSVEPMGTSLITTNQSTNYVVVNGRGITYNLFDIGEPNLTKIVYNPRPDITWPLSKDKVYYFNVQNMNNRPIRVYVKFDYLSTVIECKCD